MRPILIKNGRLIDPAQNLDSNKDKKQIQNDF